MNEKACDPKSALLRPWRSLSIPHSGDEMVAQTAVMPIKEPAIASEAPKRLAKSGSSGINIVKLRMSRNVIP